jgi:hypothetical protein
MHLGIKLNFRQKQYIELVGATFSFPCQFDKKHGLFTGFELSYVLAGHTSNSIALC